MIVYGLFYDDVLEGISKKTGAKVQKRQAEELVQRHTTIAKNAKEPHPNESVWLNFDDRKQLTFHDR